MRCIVNRARRSPKAWITRPSYPTDRTRDLYGSSLTILGINCGSSEFVAWLGACEHRIEIIECPKAHRVAGIDSGAADMWQ
jgi:hypothetical protein